MLADPTESPMAAWKPHGGCDDACDGASQGMVTDLHCIHHHPYHHGDSFRTAGSFLDVRPSGEEDGRRDAEREESFSQLMYVLYLLGSLKNSNPHTHRSLLRPPDDPLQCGVCHIAYSTAKHPVEMKRMPCAVCRSLLYISVYSDCTPLHTFGY